jgi:membrane-associated phospholipid phosphatase
MNNPAEAIKIDGGPAGRRRSWRMIRARPVGVRTIGSVREASEAVRAPAVATPARLLLLVAGGGFVVLTLLTALVGTLPFDAALHDTLTAWASPTVVAVMRVVNWGGDKYLLGPALLLVLVVFPVARARWWIWAGLMVVAPLAEGVLKEVVARPRPAGLGYGFPSGHATAAAAFFGAVFYLAGSLRCRAVRVSVRALALLAVLLVALARVILRAHWPSDALGGLALGLALASAAALLAAQPVAGDER